MNVAMQKFTKKSITQTFSDSSSVVGLFGPLFCDILVYPDIVDFSRYVGKRPFVQFNFVVYFTTLYDSVKLCVIVYNFV